MRIFFRVGPAQAHLVQHGGDPPIAVCIRCPLLRQQGLANTPPYGLARVERAERILEHHLKAAAQSGQFGTGQARQILAQKGNRSCIGLFEAHDHLGQRRLARAAFSYNAQRFSGRKCQADRFDRLQHRRLSEELFAR